MENHTEIWKPVAGYEGVYEVSNFGNVKNVATNKERKLLLNKDGYVEIVLCKDNVRKAVRVHRLVAEAFVPNPDNKPEVNHKDFDKANNHPENLEWATRKENVNHSDARGRCPRGRCPYKTSNSFCKARRNAEEHHMYYREDISEYRVVFRTKRKRVSKYFKDKAEAISFRDKTKHNK